MKNEIIEPQLGEKYRHFKSVVYKSLYYYNHELPVGTVWVRSLENFVGFKILNGGKVKRFTKI